MADGKTRIRFNAQPHHVLLADGKEIAGGQEDEIDSELAAVLANTPANNVTIVDPSAPRWPSGHKALDALAAQLGVTFPEPAEGKQKLSVPEKQAALEEATAPPAPPEHHEQPAAAEEDGNTPPETEQEEV